MFCLLPIPSFAATKGRRPFAEWLTLFQASQRQRLVNLTLK
jgi:hypothetical protein